MVHKKCWHRFGESGDGVHVFIFWVQLSFLSRLMLMGFTDCVKFISVVSGETFPCFYVSFGWENRDSHGAEGSG